MNNDHTVHLKPEAFRPQFLYKNQFVFMAILFINLPLVFSLLYLIFHPNSLLKAELIAVFLLGTIAGTILISLELYQLDQLILIATKVLNLYFKQGEVLQTPHQYKGTINKLFKAIDYGIHSCEDRLLDLKIETSTPHSEENFQFLFHKETAEDRLRQCLSIATRYRLPLCIALLRIEGLELDKIEELSSYEPQILKLVQQLTEILRDSDWAAHWTDNQFILTIFSEVGGTKIALDRILKRLNHPETSISTMSNSPPAFAPITVGFTKVQINEHYLACVDRANQALQKAQASNQSCIYL